VDFFNRNRYLLLAIVLLVILNVGTLFMLFFGRPGERQRGRGNVQDRGQTRIAQLLKDELGFDREQIEQYLVLKKRHQERMRVLDSTMRAAKNRMFDDVLRDDPAPVLSDSLLVLTQRTQDEIERLTFQHLLDVKKLCTPEQRKKLHAIIHEMFRGKPRGDEPGPPPGGPASP
jgi:hypothetical protein